MKTNGEKIKKKTIRPKLLRSQDEGDVIVLSSESEEEQDGY